MRLAALWAALLLACSSGAGSELVATERQRVIGGERSSQNDDGVVVLVVQRGSGTGVCSGSLVAPNLVLTARHCITALYTEDNIRCRADGTLDMPSGGELGPSVEAEQITLYVGPDPSKSSLSGLPGGEPAARGARVIATDWPTVCRDDVALIVLDREVPAPTLALDLTTEIKKSNEISALGYGLSEQSKSGDLWGYRRSRRDGIPIKYVDTLPATFAVGRSVCQGDSGGPALDSMSNGIVGVYSLGFPGVDLDDCSSGSALNYYARLNEYEPLLREAFTAAGQAFPEPPTGEGGAASADSDGGSAGASTLSDGDGAGAPSGTSAGGEGAITAEDPPTAPEKNGCSVDSKGSARSRWSALLALAGLAVLRERRRYGAKGLL